MHPVLLQIGPLEIRWYGVMIALACVIGLWLAGREAERKGINREIINNFFIYATISAIAGARLYYIVFAQPSMLWKNPLSTFAIWQGGLAIHGAILGGLVICVFYVWKPSHRHLFWDRPSEESGAFLTEMPTVIPHACPGAWFILRKARLVKCFPASPSTPRSYMKWF